MEYICKIANLAEITAKCDYEINKHPNDNLWIKAKENQVNSFLNKSRIVYIGLLNNEIICEATAIIKPEGFIGETADFHELLSPKRIYLCAFRTNKEYEGMGYFSKLFHFMEKDLKSKGYTELSLGVEPCEVRNMQIYSKWGFTNFLRTSKEYLAAKDEFSEPREEIVNYYFKKFN